MPKAKIILSSVEDADEFLAEIAGIIHDALGDTEVYDDDGNSRGEVSTEQKILPDNSIEMMLEIGDAEDE